MTMRLKTRSLWGYASGEGATSISMNGMSNFAMLFYTQILGMTPELAGLAFSVATVWDAVTDPLMGTISDRTRSRFGRRHPYMLIGGILLALSFFALWCVPEIFQGEKRLFGYLLSINIVIKTAFTVFVVPYTALGFEICRTDDDRARVQGIRWGFNMIINIIFGGLAWILFFQDRVVEGGSMVDGTKIQENYLSMGAVLAASTLALILFCVWATRKYAEKGGDKIAGETFGDHLRALIHDLKDVYTDRLVWIVFGFFGIAQFSMMVVSQIQMFTYVEYMKFTDVEKTGVHTGGMFGFMLGSLFLGSLTRRLGKKKTGYLSMAIASAGGLGLLAVFSGGLLNSQAEIGGFPLAVVIFGLLQMLWWGGCGILVPLATSFIGDLSRVKRQQTGEVTEGRYAAGFSFFCKAASALGLLVTGYILKSIGYISGVDAQEADTVDNLALVTFMIGPVLMAVSFLILRIYPVCHFLSSECCARQTGEDSQ